MHGKPENDCAGLSMTSSRVYLIVAALLIVDMHLEIKIKPIKGTMYFSLCSSILREMHYKPFNRWYTVHTDDNKQV